MLIEIPKHDDSYYEYKEITENPITIDFNGCNHWKTVHDILREKFGLPEYYAENWDSLWDCLSYLFTEDTEVHIYGYYSMSKTYQDYCKNVLEIFDDIHKETPNFTYKLIN